MGRPVSIDAYESLLEAEGLGVVDVSRDAVVSIERGRPEIMREVPGGAFAGADEASDRFFAWAKQVARTHRFSSSHQRRVWEFYAEGKTIREIRRALDASPLELVTRTDEARGGGAGAKFRRKRTIAVGTSIRSISRALDRVRNMVSLAPVDNPRRRLGRGKVALRGLALETLTSKVLKNLGRTAADQAELSRILEGYMATDKLLKYESIRLREPLEMPGRAVSKDTLLNVEGRPHAGGIDVQLTSAMVSDRKPRRRTVPWWNIKYADVASEGGE